MDVKEKRTVVSSKWTFHTGRITSLAFSPNGKRIASAGMDESIYVWEVEKILKNTPIKVKSSSCQVYPPLTAIERTSRWSLGSCVGRWGHEAGLDGSGWVCKDLDCARSVEGSM